jgi:hypothetical protein
MFYGPSAYLLRAQLVMPFRDAMVAPPETVPYGLLLFCAKRYCSGTKLGHRCVQGLTGQISHNIYNNKDAIAGGLQRITQSLTITRAHF